MANKKIILEQTVKVSADISNAQKNLQKLGSLLDNVGNQTKDNKMSSLTSNYEQLVGQLDKLKKATDKGFENEKSATDALGAINKVSDAIELMINKVKRMQANPANYIQTSDIQNAKKLTQELENISNAQNKINELQSKKGGLVEKKSSLEARINEQKNFVDKYQNNQNYNSSINKAFRKSDFSDSQYKEYIEASNKIKEIKAKYDKNISVEDYSDEDMDILRASKQQQVNILLKITTDGTDSATSELETINTQITQTDTQLKNMESGANLSSVKSTILEIVKAAEKAGVSLEGIDEDSIKNWDTSKILQMKDALYQLAQSTGEAEKTNFSSNLQNLLGDLENEKAEAESLSQKIENLYDSSANSRRAQQGIDTLKNRFEEFFSLQNGLRLFENAIRSAFQTIKELDSAMTETAVVTDYSISDMWGMLDTYTAKAKELGVTTKGAYETMTLYYQQGLQDQSAWDLGTETLKMARIAGMDYATTTDAMTAA